MLLTAFQSLKVSPNPSMKQNTATNMLFSLKKKKNKKPQIPIFTVN